MTTYQTKAQTHAFERGVEAYRAGKTKIENPYPREADYYDFWQQGYEREQEADGK